MATQEAGHQHHEYDERIKRLEQQIRKLEEQMHKLQQKLDTHDHPHSHKGAA